MKKRITFISFEEFQKLYKECKDRELKIAMILGYGSGLRISEIVGYKRKFKHRTNKQTKILELIPDNSEIPALTKDKIDLDKHQVMIEEAKGGKWRIAPLSPAFKPEYLKYIPLKIERRTLQNRFYSLTQKVLGHRLSFHVLRHGFGNYMVNVKKLPITMVQGLMGHSSVAVTGVYAKANPQDAINEAWKAMGGE
jgi:integrase